MPKLKTIHQQTQGLHMPTRIPVQVATQQFPSINKARIYFTCILRQYPEGGAVREEHQNAIRDLMISSDSPYPIQGSNITVARGYYGRNCFVSVGPDRQYHYVSILHSLKKCVIQPKPDDRLR